MKNVHDAEYKDMLVYADFDRDQVGMRIAIDHGLWYHKTEDFVFLEGKIPTREKLAELPENNKERILFETIRDTGNKYNNKYFVIISKQWSDTLKSEEYKNDLKEKRSQK